MFNPLYQALNPQGLNQNPTAQNKFNEIKQMADQCRQNPQQFLGGFNVPPAMFSEPYSIVNYLVQSGKIPQERLNMALNIVRQFGFRG